MKPKKKYVTISKVDKDKFVKYRVNDLHNFTLFITKKYPLFRYSNIFCNTGQNKGMLVYTYGKHKGLNLAY
jgi:hypothetical protein